ncbi:Hypothetical Protein FCC1311_042742 [Hondaea fermentalgiana]|uniref:Uncharacterized protein n=1 Tax=Hondaea fermentalgiana TaxID=2315210 RepID=A0A2R5GID9_9STRA|nr:Hypothetical Protein FCC1311_042742 [Hondaea fermentalgiana]|eukprot:GBG28051.1 Hypothetical Protein FCC1311_042742 [Hondaea fermentalgiana]
MEEPCSAVAVADEENWAAHEPEEYSWSHLSMPGLPVKANAAEERVKSSPSQLDELLEEIDAFRKLGFHDEAKEYNS